MAGVLLFPFPWWMYGAQKRASSGTLWISGTVSVRVSHARHFPRTVLILVQRNYLYCLDLMGWQENVWKEESSNRTKANWQWEGVYENNEHSRPKYNKLNALVVKMHTFSPTYLFSFFYGWVRLCSLCMIHEEEYPHSFFCIWLFKVFHFPLDMEVPAAINYVSS